MYWSRQFYCLVDTTVHTLTERIGYSVCNLQIDYFDYEKKSNGFFRFIATCKSVIRNIKSILVINALLIYQ